MEANATFRQEKSLVIVLLNKLLLESPPIRTKMLTHF